MNGTSARPHRTAARGRALLVVGVAATAAAIGLAASAVRGPAATLQVDDAVAAVVPDTVPPLVTSPPPVGDQLDEPLTAGVATDEITDISPGSAGAPPATVGLSPLAALVGERGSAIPVQVPPRATPTGLAIDDLDLLGDVRDVGLRPDGALEVPDVDEIGWYRYGAAPGRSGATVLAAHVSWNGELGPFFRLGELEPGARVEVVMDDDSTRVYEVVERTMYDKDALPQERLWRNTGPETLVLITCGGDFNPEIRRYRQNIVVYAVPVA